MECHKTPARVAGSRPFEGEREFGCSQPSEVISRLNMDTPLATTSSYSSGHKVSVVTPPVFCNRSAPTISPNFESIDTKLFKVKDVVKVKSRTWPGINKPGGMGRVTKVNTDGTYNVAYILGGRENNIDAKFISESGLMTYVPDRTIKPRAFYKDYVQENVASIKRKSKIVTPAPAANNKPKREKKYSTCERKLSSKRKSYGKENLSSQGNLNTNLASSLKRRKKKEFNNSNKDNLLSVRKSKKRKLKSSKRFKMATQTFCEKIIDFKPADKAASLSIRNSVEDSLKENTICKQVNKNSTLR